MSMQPLTIDKVGDLARLVHEYKRVCTELTRLNLVQVYDTVTVRLADGASFEVRGDFVKLAASAFLTERSNALAEELQQNGVDVTL